MDPMGILKSMDSIGLKCWPITIFLECSSVPSLDMILSIFGTSISPFSKRDVPWFSHIHILLSLHELPLSSHMVPYVPMNFPFFPMAFGTSRPQRSRNSAPSAQWAQWPGAPPRSPPCCGEIPSSLRSKRKMADEFPSGRLHHMYI